jgi:malonyl-CoA decarboxylase
MPDEPLIFVEVALTDGLAGNIQALLDPQGPVGDPRKADTAIFYSISNAQKGLTGISFGGFLIKRVVDELTAEFENLTTYATLSPIPGFRAWLTRQWSADESALLTAAEIKALTEAAGVRSGALAALLARPDWKDSPDLVAAMKRPLMRLCARYLMEEKRDDGRAIDPVANFHLSNGARLERLNWLADTSGKGLAQSAGLMINYLYEVYEIPRNHEAYVGDGEIPASSAMRASTKA